MVPRFRMTVSILLALAFGVSVWFAAPPRQTVQADSGGVVRFATLPNGAPGHPEGLAADATGTIYAASFELPGATLPTAPFPPRRKGPAGQPEPPFDLNYIYAISQSGQLQSSTPLPAGVVPLGMVAVGQVLYVNDVLNGKVLRYSLPLTSTSLPTQTYSICGGFVVAFGAPGEFCALNANDVGPDGRIYVTDNGAGANVAFPGSPAFPNGRIFVLDPGTGTATVWLDPAQFDVSPTGFPPFGANGIAFAKDGSAVFVANMSTHTIYRVGLTGCATACNPGALSVFVGPSSGIRGPDNMVFDDVGNLWVASGQTDQVVAVNPQGQVIKRLGSFDGLSNDGAPKGLLQPSGLAFANGKLYVGNEANQNLRPATDPIPWAQLKLFTISRVTP